MRRTFIILFAIICLIMAPFAFADSPGGHSNGQGFGHGGGFDGKSAHFEGAPGGSPPGLRGNGHEPPGLAKQGKVPPGWNKGKKEGWEKGAPTPFKGFGDFFEGGKD